jgi:hypothetical protein
LRNTLESPLLRLPGELRNAIYEYALGGRQWDIDCWRKARVREKFALSVLQTCRQMHSEASTVPWSSNTFSFDHPDDIRRTLFGAAQKRRAAITSFRLVSECVCEYRSNPLRLKLPPSYYGSYLKFSDFPGLKRLEVCIEVDGHVLGMYNRLLDGSIVNDEIKRASGLAKEILEKHNPGIHVVMSFDLVFKERVRLQY